MYRETFACIKQSAHEQLFERDCRCMRVAEKSVYTYRKTQYLFFPAKIQVLANFRSLTGNDLETSEILYFTSFYSKSKERF